MDMMFLLIFLNRSKDKHMKQKNMAYHTLVQLFLDVQSGESKLPASEMLCNDGRQVLDLAAAVFVVLTLRLSCLTT